MIDALLDLVNTVLSWLPQSPFANVPSTISSSQGIAWLCWFFPVHDCLLLMTAWIGAIALYYLAVVALRWVKVIS